MPGIRGGSVMEIDKICVVNTSFSTTRFSIKGNDVTYFTYIRELKECFLTGIPIAEGFFIEANTQLIDDTFVDPEVFFLLHN